MKPWMIAGALVGAWWVLQQGGGVPNISLGRLVGGGGSSSKEREWDAPVGRPRDYGRGWENWNANNLNPREVDR